MSLGAKACFRCASRRNGFRLAATGYANAGNGRILRGKAWNGRSRFKPTAATPRTRDQRIGDIPDPVLPAQWFESRVAIDLDSGEVRLRLALLHDALDQLRKPSTKIRARRNTWRWLRGAPAKITLAEVCSALGLDEGAVRGLARRLEAGVDVPDVWAGLKPRR